MPGWWNWQTHRLEGAALERAYEFKSRSGHSNAWGTLIRCNTASNSILKGRRISSSLFYSHAKLFPTSSGPELTPRTRLLTTISSLYTIREREQAFRIVERAIARKSYPVRFFSEIFIQYSLFLGYPAMLDGLERLSAIRRERKTRLITSRKRNAIARKGARILRQIYGDQTEKLIARLDKLEKGLGNRITKDAYGAIMGRPGLPLADREIVNVVVLFIDGFEPQLYSHLRGAIRVGVKPRILRSVLLLAAHIAARSPRRAIHMLNRIQQNEVRRSF